MIWTSSILLFTTLTIDHFYEISEISSIFSLLSYYIPSSMGLYTSIFSKTALIKLLKAIFSTFLSKSFIKRLFTIESTVFSKQFFYFLLAIVTANSFSLFWFLVTTFMTLNTLYKCEKVLPNMSELILSVYSILYYFFEFCPSAHLEEILHLFYFIFFQ